MPYHLCDTRLLGFHSCWPARREKRAAEERMAIVQAKLDEAQAEFDTAMRQKQALEEDAAATQKKMDSASALIGALAGEETRWSAQSKEFDSTIQRLTGDCCIASAFVSYLGPFNREFRDLLVSRDFFSDCTKLRVPFTPDLKLTKFLVDDATIGEWNLQARARCVFVLPCRAWSCACLTGLGQWYRGQCSRMDKLSAVVQHMAPWGVACQIVACPILPALAFTTCCRFVRAMCTSPFQLHVSAPGVRQPSEALLAT
jgi:Microtubule-binding stalk of dynein motor